MKNLVRVEVVALLPTNSGCAVFLGDTKKVILFYIDPAIGASINVALTGIKAPRPLTHDLFAETLTAFGGDVLHCTIVNEDAGVFFARLYLTAENEVLEKKVVELDARPSDCLALAVRAEAPIFVTREVWDRLDDMTEALEELRLESGEHEGFGLDD